ncbi:hypothetical protein DRW48_10415 [Paracoccus suum]|uniref:Uncharacterized protein n=1 Tax=Paracoccus suum TaxID=2259340 RepID=A0A344PKZ3_9RHOB|nr:hypothetical protein [Paracoccus suum]AXC50048.1 hypothetical protein DRW48_10415 [Paracoccus suum]
MRAGLVLEDRGEVNAETGRRVNPNKVYGARRVDMLEVWHRRGVISTAGFTAAEKLRDAFEGTQRGPGWPENDRVQSSPKPDHAVTIQVDRISRYAKLAAYVTREDWPIVEACVLDGRTPAAIRGFRGKGYQTGLVALHDALDRMACAMGS